MANVSKKDIDSWARALDALIVDAMAKLKRQGRGEAGFSLRFFEAGAPADPFLVVDLEDERDTDDPRIMAELVAEQSYRLPATVQAVSNYKGPAGGYERLGSVSLVLADTDSGWRTFGAAVAGALVLAATAIPVGLGIAAGGWAWRKATDRGSK